MRDKVHVLSIAMHLLGSGCLVGSCMTFLTLFNRVDHWFAVIVCSSGIIVGCFYIQAAYCLEHYRNREFVRAVIAGGLPLSCMVFPLPLALPIALGGTAVMRAWDVRWTFEQVAKGVPLKEVLATTPPPETFGDMRDDYDDELFEKR